MDKVKALVDALNNASTPFALASDFKEMQEGFAALYEWMQETEARLDMLQPPSPS